MAGKAETPKLKLSVDSPFNNQSFSVENLSTRNAEVGSLAFNGDYPASGIQETSPDLQETGLEISRTRIVTSLYPDSIWAVKNSRINGGNHLGSFQGYNDMNYQPKYNEGSSTLKVEQVRENFSTVRHDSDPAMLNQEISNNCGFQTAGCAFIKFANSPQGSQSLQDILALNNSHLTSLLLKRITALVNEIPVIGYLIVDQHGCCVCSKLLNFCDDQQLALILKTITSNIELLVTICCNITGSRTIKKLIRLVKRSPLMYNLTTSLCMRFHQLMIDPVGSYVVVFCLDFLDAKQNVSIFESAISNCLILATEPIGCVSVNNVIDRIQGSHRQILLELISNNAVFLSQDPSGNHVVQKVLGLENPIFCARIGSMLRGHYAKLSFQKWGSHVVEKCLTSQAMNCAVEDLLACSENQLLQISRDQFGNYVIQKALKVTKKRNNSLHLRLLNRFAPNLDALRNGYGKRVYSLIIDGVPLDS